jgi:hypothetical protein
MLTTWPVRANEWSRRNLQENTAIARVPSTRMRTRVVGLFTLHATALNCELASVYEGVGTPDAVISGEIQALTVSMGAPCAPHRAID